MFFFFLIKLNVQGKKQVQMEKIFRMIDFINSIFFLISFKTSDMRKEKKNNSSEIVLRDVLRTDDKYEQKSNKTLQ